MVTKENGMTESSHVAADDPAIAQSFAILVYPFRHDIAGRDRRDRLRALWPHWRPWWSRLSAPEVDGACDDSRFFLPYVRELLFPELCLPADGHRSGAVEGQGERLGRLTEEDLAALPHTAVIRLTRRSPWWDDLRNLRVEQGRPRDGQISSSLAAEIELSWADVFLFPQSIGFLCLKVRTKERGSALGGFRELLRHLRLVEPPAVGWPLASLRGTRTADFDFEVRNLVSYLLKGLIQKGDLVDQEPGKGLKSGNTSETFAHASLFPRGHLYGHTFNVFSFALLEPDPAAADAAAAPARDCDELIAPHPLQAPALRTLYDLATCTDSTQSDYAPHPSYAQQLLADNLFAHWENWQALALHDNVAFLGTRATGFTQGALGHNVESVYFYLYIMTLFQKNRMSVMLGEVMRRDARLHRNLEKARRLWKAFLTFQDHYWFNEVTPRRQGTELYRCYQRGLDLLPLFTQLSGRVRDLQDHLERQYERRLDRLMKFVTFVAFPTTWMISIYGRLFDPAKGWKWAGEWAWAEVIGTAGVLYGGFFLLGLIWVYLRPE